ncbi:MAG TPA: MBL fold metallo-hydrolase [Candidatus Bathyarchaeia archaeon]|nr:MBL fold metallo-hydrolase [Candidatus Bathyarchaeia archaeon]
MIIKDSGTYGGTTIKLLAHAGFQIKTRNKVVYIDLEEHGKTSEKADLILVTHSHPDHSDLSKIKMVCKKDTIVIAPTDCVSKISGNIKTLKPGEETTVIGISIKAIDADNHPIVTTFI